MKRFHLILFTVLLSSIFGTQLHADLKQVARNAQQRAIELRREEQNRYDYIVNSRDLEEYKQFIADYPKGKNTPEIKRRAAEIELWNNAKAANTIAAYQNYISKSEYKWYKDDAEYYIKEIRKKEEKAAWDRVDAQGTLEAYRQYLKENPNSAYKYEAERKIQNLEAEEAWAKIKNSNSTADFEEFIAQYPNSEVVQTARKRRHILKGRDYYNQGNLKSAYDEFSKVNYYDIDEELIPAYKAAEEHHEYSRLNEYSSESALESFINKYPNGVYSDNVANMIAKKKAKNFSDYATEFQYNEALSYAQDEYTKNFVLSYINLNKQKQKDRRSAWKSVDREKNGGLVNLGLNYVDLYCGLKSSAGTTFGYNVGLLCRIGNYKDPVQFAFGFRMGVIRYEEFYYRNNSDVEIKFHLPLLAQLKVNLFSITDHAKFFIFGQFRYNAVRAKYAESSIGWGVGLGIAWKHVECSFDYRQDIGKPESWNYKNMNYLCTSLSYYWKL